MAYKVEAISKPYDLGEGPFWDEKQQALFFINVNKSEINKYTPETGTFTSVKLGDKPVSFVIATTNEDEYAVGYGRDLVIVKWDGKSDKVESFDVISEIDPREGNKLNDAKVSPDGILFLGSMGKRALDGEQEMNAGSLYCYINKKAKELVKNVSISNGIAWTADLRKVYYVDTGTLDVKEYDYDSSSDEVIKNERIAFVYEPTTLAGLDGMTIDEEGKLWIAVFGDSAVLRVDPVSGELLKEIKLPSKNITSVTFGGANLDELFVTSACGELPVEEREETSGSLFKITGLGVKGTKNQYYPASQFETNEVQ